MKRYICDGIVKGATHVRNQMPCQDNKRIVEISDKIAIVAVADGHGSSKCPRSDRGSMIAVNSFYEVMKNYLKVYGEDETGLSNLITFLNREGDMRFAQDVCEEWQARVKQSFYKNKVDGMTDEDGNIKWPSVFSLYGTTLLGMLVTDSFVFSFQIGDGDISAVTKEEVEPLVEPEKFLGTETHSLSKPDAWRKAVASVRRREMESEEPYMYILSTDGFPNKYIYKRLLQNHTSVLNSRKNIVKTEPLSGDALNLVNLAGTYCAADKNTDGSRFNILSAIISFSTAVAADQKTIERVGIITPYAAQTRLIRAMLKDYYKQNDHHISCATVHQFQGSEADLIVFDAVESYPKAAVGYLMGKEPDSIMRLINVAITRAKGKLITVANDKFWINLYKGTNHIFYKLLDYIKEGHKVVSNSEKTLLPYVEDVNPGSMRQIYTNEDAAIFMLENDLEKSKGRVVVSLPSSNLRETQGQIIQAIDDAHNRGIDIWMKSNEYSGLSDAWKRYCVGTENATFPLIVIDDEIAWYGLPTATWSFKVDKSSSLKTVLHVMVRIKGKNTIEMIKALTELEVIQVGVNKRPLSNKENSLKSNITEGQSIKSIGLAAFVEEKEFCPDCRSHMILAKNQRGTAYLRCSNKNCKKMKYLTADLMNWYISNHNVECPKNDGGELKGILGKYGPCVKCSRGHFLKPEEI